MKNDEVNMTSYTITSDPLKDTFRSSLPLSEQNKLDKIYKRVMKKAKNTVPEILCLIEKYPNYLPLYNYLWRAYHHIGDQEKYKETVCTTYARFPDYFFAKTAYANMHLFDGDIKTFEEVFDNKYDLKLLYPDRDEFHISEFLAAAYSFGIYFCHIGKLDRADAYVKILEDMGLGDDPTTNSIRKKIFSTTLERIVLESKTPKQRAKKLRKTF